MKWFDHLRGRVNAFSVIAVSLGFSASPLWISKIIDTYGWKYAWLFMAAGVVVSVFLFWQFFRDNPEEYGLKPDSKLLHTKAKDDS